MVILRAEAQEKDMVKRRRQGLHSSSSSCKSGEACLEEDRALNPTRFARFIRLIFSLSLPPPHNFRPSNAPIHIHLSFFRQSYSCILFRWNRNGCWQQRKRETKGAGEANIGYCCWLGSFVNSHTHHALLLLLSLLCLCALYKHHCHNRHLYVFNHRISPFYLFYCCSEFMYHLNYLRKENKNKNEFI